MKTEQNIFPKKVQSPFPESLQGYVDLRTRSIMNADKLVQFAEQYDVPVSKTESDFFINCCMKKGYVGPFKVYLDLNTMQLKYIQVGDCSVISFMMFKALFKKEKAFLSSLGIKLKEAHRHDH